ncbi:MAG: LD-carboxypeptidase [Bacteroidota bacterium]
MSITTHLLKSGDNVSIISPSRVIFEDQMIEAKRILKTWGLNVIEGCSLYSQSGYFAGTDDDRLIELQQVINDPSIRAIFCARGGYGLTRFLDELDVTPLLKRPKWIVGFSDITALHLKLNLAGIESIHGLMPVQFEYSGVKDSIASLYKILFHSEGEYKTETSIDNVSGEAIGTLVGGNLCLICDSLGTSSEINTDDKILFLEEIDEYLYKIDRMLNQLKRSGKFQNLKGVIIGDFSKVKDTEIAFGISLIPLIKSYFGDKNIPLMFGFPAGHEPLHWALPLGRRVELSVDNNGCRLTF